VPAGPPRRQSIPDLLVTQLATLSRAYLGAHYAPPPLGPQLSVSESRHSGGMAHYESQIDTRAAQILRRRDDHMVSARATREDNVWFDDEHRLHLRVTEDASGNWNAVEVVLQASFGYGTYRFQLDGPPPELDANVVLGLFTWNDYPAENHREMNIVFARWGQPAALMGGTACSHMS
jgi:hypothetical protein